jgi:hypothetical protein
MTRANRHFLPGHVWHLAYRCHQKKFLLKFALDRRLICPRQSAADRVCVPART